MSKGLQGRQEDAVGCVGRGRGSWKVVRIDETARVLPS